ncbi:MAG: bestrophin family protein [Pseudomonadota bacterium]|nr:bestrophin family protein [Pseudomonadota bacterium]
MIVRSRPGPFTVLFALRGSIVPRVASRVGIVAAISAVVTAVHHLRPGLFAELPAAPFTLLGLGLSIFLGFRNSACYDRWWEARRQWGQLLTEVRNLSRQFEALLPGRHDVPTRCIVAFTLALAARLRGTDPVVAARRWLEPEDAAALAGRSNVPDVILRQLTARLAAAMERGDVTDVSFAAMESHVAALCGIQAACDRIRTTPTPFAYSLLLHRTAWLFCLLVPFALVGATGLAAPLLAAILAYAFFGLDALGDELEEPFALRPNTIPLDAMARTVEIELLEALGERDLPAPIRPVDYILS